MNKLLRDKAIRANALQTVGRAFELQADPKTIMHAPEYWRTAASEYRRIGMDAVADLCVANATKTEATS